MKCTGPLVYLVLLLAVVRSAARHVAIARHAAVVQKRNTTSPVARVVTLITELKATIEADGAAEQTSYDKYACWCENTMERKAASIDEAKKTIDDLSAAIKKASAEIASHEAAIGNLKKDIAANVESQSEATELREKEKAAFAESKTESESSIKALEAAITVLDGAGMKKTTLLGTLQEAQVLGVVAGVKTVLKSSTAAQKLSSQEMEVMDKFVAKPEDFVGSRLSGFMSAAQIANNPFGDYAPQSTRIQGILKQLKEDFDAALASSIKEEEEKEAAFQDLMKTKQMEAGTLQKTLQLQEASASSKASQLATDKTLRDDTTDELSANEDFFAETKSSCKEKAGDWAERTRLRTEELSGIAQAIAILSSPEAVATFEGSTSKLLFFQVQSESEGDRRQKAYKELKKLATKFHSLGMAQIAAEVTSGGHFDKVIAMIDVMMQTLREEEAEDITHRDLCQTKENANTNEMEDLNHDISKAGQEIGRTQSSIDTLQGQIDALKAEINETETDLGKLLQTRNEGEAAFKEALTHDTEAVALLEKAIVYLTQFYVNNKLAVPGLLQAPNYTVSEDTAPETWTGAYTGRSSEGTGIVAILKLIKEDTEKEIMKLQEGESADQAEYWKMRTSLEDSLASQKALQVAKEKALHSLMEKRVATEEEQGNAQQDLLNEQSTKSALEIDCAWVTSTFKSRRDKRKLEMDGLVEAKAFLAGVESGEAVLDPDR